VADMLTGEARSRLMSRIRSKDTVPEMLVRRWLHAHGLRYRLHARNLPGKPDIVLPKYMAIINVRGCFWHQHGCKRGSSPKSNTDYWWPKLQRNVERDWQNSEAFLKLGWREFIVWECQVKKQDRGQTLARLLQLVEARIGYKEGRGGVIPSCP
jgi:DNA mismatch endonuclease (patch repair protein)